MTTPDPVLKPRCAKLDSPSSPCSRPSTPTPQRRSSISKLTTGRPRPSASPTSSAAVRAHPGAALVASGDAALAGLLAAAITPLPVAVLDVGEFDSCERHGLPESPLCARPPSGGRSADGRGPRWQFDPDTQCWRTLRARWRPDSARSGSTPSKSSLRSVPAATNRIHHPSCASISIRTDSR